MATPVFSGITLMLNISGSDPSHIEGRTQPPRIMKIKILGALMLLFVGISLGGEDDTHLAYDIIPDVILPDEGTPVIEAYHLILSLKDVELTGSDGGVRIVKRMYCWKFSDYREGLEVRKKLYALGALLSSEDSETLSQLSAIVKELTSASEPTKLQ